jgi:hypothetical protein
MGNFWEAGKVKIKSPPQPPFAKGGLGGIKVKVQVKVKSLRLRLRFRLRNGDEKAGAKRIDDEEGMVVGPPLYSLPNFAFHSFRILSHHSLRSIGDEYVGTQF